MPRDCEPHRDDADGLWAGSGGEGPPPRSWLRQYGLPALGGALFALALYWAYGAGKRQGGGPGDAGGGGAALSSRVRDDSPSAPPTSPAWLGERDIDPVLVNDLYHRSRKLVPFAERLGPARPGEWRQMAQEASQSYYQFARDPRRPALGASARTVILQPMGDLSPAASRLLPKLGEFLSCYFDLPVRVSAPLGVRAIPEAAWRRRSGQVQLDAEYAMSHVLAPRIPPDGALVVGISGADLRPGGHWEYQSAFGWSSFHGRTALVSMARAFPGNDRREAALPDLLHMLKFTAHEASHALGMLHCDRYACLMNGRASLQENAAKPMWLCPDCYAKMSLATGFNGPRRARRLADFCARNGLDAERDHWRGVERAVD